MPDTEVTISRLQNEVNNLTHQVVGLTQALHGAEGALAPVRTERDALSARVIGLRAHLVAILAADEPLSRPIASKALDEDGYIEPST